MRKQRRGIGKIVAANVLAIILLVSMFSPMCFAETGNTEVMGEAIQKNIEHELEAVEATADAVKTDSDIDTDAISKVEKSSLDIFLSRDIDSAKEWVEE